MYSYRNKSLVTFPCFVYNKRSIITVPHLRNSYNVYTISHKQEDSKLNTYYENLKTHIDKYSALNMALTLFNWDSSTEAPKDATELTSKYIGILSENLYNTLINDDVEGLIEKLKDADDLTVEEKAIVRKTSEMFDDIRYIPADEFSAYQALLAKSDAIWAKAKAENDYNSFAPVLKEIIDYNKKFASYKAKARGYEGPLYDILLDDYEKGFTTQVLDEFFSRLKATIVPLVKGAVKNNHLIDKDFNYLSYDVEKQAEISRKLAEHIGFDFNRGVIKTSVHPFTTNLHNKDVRITTAYKKNNLESAMFSTIHEGGHALYEMHVSDDFTGTPASYISMGMHESQSRLFENNLGRSEAFWKPLYPMLKEAYPEQLKDVTLEHFIHAINKSVPNLIRTEADELTYCLHIMVRYEIEKMIFSGEEIDIYKLPEIWNDKYEEYLGIRPENDAQGILQDIHWAIGSIGYFPSYAIGTAIAAQIYAHLQKVMPLDEYLSSGNLQPVNDYLKENLHKYAGSKTTKELLEGLMGEDFNPEYYINYLKEKYTKLYNL